MRSIPLSKNQDVTLQIDALSSEGQGIGRYEGFAVFVPFALPGEKAEVKIIKTFSNYAVGRLERVIDSAPERVEPACGVFQRCGGCQIQHMDYTAQLKFKRQVVVDALERLGGFENAGAIVADTVGGEQYAYRNKGSFPVRSIEGKAVCGLFAPRSHRLIPVGHCPIACGEVNAALGVIAGWLGDERVSGYDEERHAGDVRHIVVRAAKGGTMAALVTAGNRLPGEDALISALRDSGVATCLVHNVNKDRTNTILGRSSRVKWGGGLIEELCGLKFGVSDRSFLQINREQAQKLYGLTRDALDLSGNETVLDAYCGVGTIALSLCGAAKSVVGIENVEEAVLDARKNAALNGIKNASFHLGDVESVLPELVKGGARFGAAVIDPPRKGCDKAVLDALTASGVERIAYVSCNPATLARDAALLRAGGFEAVGVTPVDMFPQSAHVEVVMKLSKKTKGK